MSKVEAIFSHKQAVPEPEIDSVERGYVGADGVMVPTVDGYREMKVAATYDTSFARETVAGNLHYHALLAEPEVFGKHLWVMLKQRGIYDAIESVWGCDGARWIWRQKELHDPDGKEIVDYIHASEYLQKVANAICRNHVGDVCGLGYESVVASQCWMLSGNSPNPIPQRSFLRLSATTRITTAGWIILHMRKQDTTSPAALLRVPAVMWWVIDSKGVGCAGQHKERNTSLSYA